MHGQTQSKITKLVVTICNFANAPKNLSTMMKPCLISRKDCHGIEPWPPKREEGG